MGDTSTIDTNTLLNNDYTIISDLQPDSTLEVVNESSGASTNPAVLCTLYGKVLDYSRPTRNKRLYTESLCDAIANSSRVEELTRTKNFLGEGDHPMTYQNRADIHYPLVTHAVRGLIKVPAENCYKAYIDILDTPNGRVIKTLVDYGTIIGVSSRGFGRDKKRDESGVLEVTPDNYIFLTFDLVAYPGNITARVDKVDDNSIITESETYSIDEVNKLINENFTEITKDYLDSNDTQSLESLKPVLTYFNESGQLDELIQEVDKAINKQTSTSSNSLVENLLQAYAQVSDLEDQLKEKELIINHKDDELTQLRSTSSELEGVVDGLRIQIDDLELEKEGLSTKINNLLNKVSYQESRLTSMTENYELLENELADSRKELADEVNNHNEAYTKLCAVNESFEREVNDLSNEVKSLESELELSRSNYSQLMESYIDTKVSSLPNVTKDDVLTMINESTNTLDTVEVFKVNNAVSHINRVKSAKRVQSIVRPLNESTEPVRIRVNDDAFQFSIDNAKAINESAELNNHQTDNGVALDSIREVIKLSNSQPQ